MVPVWIGCNYNVEAAGQRLVYTFKRFATHDNHSTPGSVFKKLKIIGQMPKQLVVFANGIVIGSSYYQRNIDVTHWVKIEKILQNGDAIVPAPYCTVVEECDAHEAEKTICFRLHSYKNAAHFRSCLN